MTIYDHLLMFADDTSAFEALRTVSAAGDVLAGVDPLSGLPFWNGSCVQAGVPVTLPTGPNGERVPIAAFFVRVSLAARSVVLENLPGNACRAIGIQETGEVVMVATDDAAEIAAATRVEVVPCGSGYDFPAE